MIKVKKKNEQQFLVTIEERGSTTEHVVTLDDGYYQNLTDGKITREENYRRERGLERMAVP